MTKNLPVSIVVSDPWDLGETTNWQPILSEIILIKDNSALIKFHKDIVYRGLTYYYAVIQPRTKKDNLNDLERGIVISCDCVGIDEDHAISKNPLDLSWWRGGLAFIGTITSVKKFTSGKSST